MGYDLLQPDKTLRGDACFCSTCGQYFMSTWAFDKHRVGPWTRRRCLAVKEMRERGMQCTERGFWRTPNRYRKEAA